LPEHVIADIQAATRTLQERLGALNDAYWRSVRAFDGYAMLSELTIPVVEMYGTAGWREDALTSPLIPDKPNIQIRWIHGAGHFLLHERPHEVAQVCREARAMITQEVPQGEPSCNPTSS